MLRGLHHFLRALGLCMGTSILAACDSSSSAPAPIFTPPAEYVVSGAAVNGPLAMAEVTVSAADGALLGQTTTGKDGRYTLKVHVPPPYRLIVRGGMLNEVPYRGDLKADCESGMDCNVTPFTTAIAQLIDEHGFHRDEARASITQALGVDQDPFVQVLIDGEPDPQFDLDQARNFIDGGEQLDGWVAGIVAWSTGGSPHPDPPAGVIVMVDVAATASSGGSIDPANRVVRYGEQARFVVTPEPNHGIVAVTGCGGSLSGNLYTTEPLTSGCTVAAQFSLQSHVVTTLAGEGGTIDASESHVPHNGTLTLSVRPESGYRIREVVGCGGELRGNIYTTAPITSNCTVNARFDRLTHVALGVAGPGGTIMPSTTNVLHGQRTSFQLTAQDGWRIATAFGCGGELRGNIYLTAQITSNCTVDARFERSSHVALGIASPGGTIMPSTRNVLYGERTSFTIAADVGYRIDSVRGCDGTLDGEVYTTAAITETCSVIASFSALRYTVKASADEGGDITPSDVQLDHGQSASFVLRPHEGYEIEAVQGCGGTLDHDIYTTDFIKADCEIRARFSRKTYLISASAMAGGSVTPESSDVTHGERVQFTLLPDIGYRVDTVTGCAGQLTDDTFLTEPITSTCTVNATFKLKTYTVTARAGAGGRVTPDTVDVEHGQKITFDVIPEPGFRVAEVRGCNGALDEGRYTTGAITADCELTAAFEVSLAAPEHLSAEPEDHRVKLLWDPVEDAESYEVYHALESFDPENYLER